MASISTASGRKAGGRKGLKRREGGGEELKWEGGDRERDMGLKVGGHKGVCPRAVNHFSHALCSINYSTSSKKMGIRSLLDTSFINLIIHTYVYVYF